jgi:hypothetical protein
MASTPNYIPDTNPFKLAGPPAYFLRRLWDFDKDLVVIPSRQSMVYRLALRRKLRLPEHIVAEALWQDSDTQMMARHGLVPVTTILATANWDNPLLFQELAARSPHRQGGAEKVIQVIEAREAEEEAKKRAEFDDYQTHLYRDGFRLYRKKIGLGRTFHHAPGVLSPKEV